MTSAGPVRRQRSSTYNEADEAEQRRLERHPEFGHAGAVLVGARLASDGEHLPNGLPVASASPVVGCITRATVSHTQMLQDRQSPAQSITVYDRQSPAVALQCALTVGGK